jgi:hypothetical chaperone protein
MEPGSGCINLAPKNETTFEHYTPPKSEYSFKRGNSSIRKAMLAYAIDFGTSNSLLAAADENRVYPPVPLDPFAADPTVLRTLLYFPTPKQCFYGAQAIQEFVQNDLHGRLIRSVKKFLPMRSFKGTLIDQRHVNLEDLIATFLKEMRRRGNEHFKQEVESVVLGRPARFSSDPSDDRYAQDRLENAARLAGFRNIEFCPEPVAAAREFRTQLKESKTVLVADFGGGTSDYTILKISSEPYQDSDVLAIGGIPLAGDALDGGVMRHRISTHFGSGVRYQVPFGSNILTMPGHLMEKICSPADISVLRERDTLDFFANVQTWTLDPEDQKKMDQLFLLIHDNLGFGVFEEIDRIKRKLSSAEDGEFEFSYSDLLIQEKIQKKEFEKYIEPQVEKILEALDDTIARAGIQKSEIDIVYCTGGTSRVPFILEGLKRRFGAEKMVERNFFHSIVQGLAERAQEMARER